MSTSGFSSRTHSMTFPKHVSDNTYRFSLSTRSRCACSFSWWVDSSPETYSTLENSPNFLQIWSISVDLPIPGAPPTNTSDPLTAPPPKTRSSSPHTRQEADLVRGAQFCDAFCLYSCGKNRLSSAFHRLIRLLHNGIPCTTGGTASRPLGRLIAALRAEKKLSSISWISPYSLSMIPKIQVSGHNGRRQTFLLLRLSEQLRLVGVRQEAALHQHPRTRDVLHEVHRVPYGLGGLFRFRCLLSDSAPAGWIAPARRQAPVDC